MASTAYSKTTRFAVADITARLSAFTGASDHVFWTDTLSLRDSRHFRHTSILTSKQITDIYLLALAVENQGSLATFDQHIPLAAVPTANPGHLVVL